VGPKSLIHLSRTGAAFHKGAAPFSNKQGCVFRSRKTAETTGNSMLLFILRRFAVMVFTALCLTFIVFFMTNLYPNLEKLAKSEGNFRMDDAAVASFLDNRGYLDPLPIKYGRWLGVLPGYVIEGSDGKTRGQCF